jgi:hypothetical protein
MRNTTFKSRKTKIVTLVVATALIIGGVIAFKILHKPTITTYKDEDFIIYDCSRPIKAKQGSVPNLLGGRMDALVPADEQEARQYCRATGIE